VTAGGPELVLGLDLHTHSSASDGTQAPAELVAAAAAAGVRALALTDHDTTAGLAEAGAAAERLGLTLIPGIELNTDDTAGGADILGYGFDPADEALQRLLSAIRAARDERAREMVAKLRALGSAITYEDVAALAGPAAIGRPHVAEVLLAQGFVASYGEAFRRYLGDGAPAHAPRYKLSAAEACQAVRAAGGLPSLAHPVPPDNPMSDPKRLRHYLPRLVEAGLGGLECYYPGYTVTVNRWLEALAWHFKLVPTGGSDHHGLRRADRPLGSVRLPADTLERIEAARRPGPPSPPPPGGDPLP
jgi:predicted metal-dependent phosphoesterase TrpH